MIDVLLADDHAVVRDGLKALLQAQPDIRVVALAADGRQALEQAQEQCPDVAVMDIAMPQLNGIDAALQMREHCPQTKIVILSIHATVEYVARALQAGARGYLLKESAGKEVVEAVRAVQAGRRYLSEKVNQLVVADYARQEITIASPLESLSAREREVLQLTVEGKTSAEIAETLSLARSTVETYRSRIMTKLDIHDLPGLVKFALQHGLISLE